MTENQYSRKLLIFVLHLDLDMRIFTFLYVALNMYLLVCKN